MKVAVTSPSFSKNKLLKQIIFENFKQEDVKLNLDGVRFSKTELIEFIKDCDGIIVGLEDIDEQVLDACSKLKIISKYGVGLNNIDLNACERRGVKIGWTGGVNKLSVAEMTLGYMLMLCRNLFITSNQLKSGIWEKDGGFQLTNKTIGIIGVGHVGKELIRLLKPFNCTILVNDIIEQKEYYQKENLIETTKEKIFTKSDIITVHTPYNNETHNLISRKDFESMKSSAYVINSSRGGIINEKDLKEALVNNTIAGAAIDAYIEEPPTDKELISLPNLICTPHIGGNAKEAIESMGISAIKHLVEFNK